MRHHVPFPDDLTPEQIIQIRGMPIAELARIAPVDVHEMCDVALDRHRTATDRQLARIRLARVYERAIADQVVTVDPLLDLLNTLALWAEARLFDDDQKPSDDTSDQKVVRAYCRWAAAR